MTTNSAKTATRTHQDGHDRPPGFAFAAKPRLPSLYLQPDRSADPPDRRHLTGQPGPERRPDRLPASRGPPAHPRDHRLPRRGRGHLSQPDHHRPAVDGEVHLAGDPRAGDGSRSGPDPDPASSGRGLPRWAGSSTGNSAPWPWPGRKRQDLAVPVNAFVTDSIDIQRDQFLRINNTKPAAARSGHRTPPEHQQPSAAASRSAQDPVGAVRPAQLRRRVAVLRADQAIVDQRRAAQTDDHHRHQHRQHAQRQPDVSRRVPVSLPQHDHRRDRLRRDLAAAPHLLDAGQGDLSRRLG